MKNSLKVLMGVLFIFVFAGQVFAGSKYHEGRTGTSKQSDHLYHNAANHMKPYLPTDLLAINNGIGILCDEAGNDVSERSDNRPVARCHMFGSQSSNTKWKIRVSRNGLSEVFKVQNNGNLLLWASFTRNKDVYVPTYLHPGAQQYASSRGNNTNAAKNPDEENVKIDPTDATADIVKKGLGVLKGFKF